MALLELTDRGLWCEAGGFHVDPWRAVDRALITHAHGDHLTWGCSNYLTAQAGTSLVSTRLGGRGDIAGIAYGESRTIGEVSVSFHPAGHILGSAQIRVEHRGEVWVVSGDYKTDPDPTCTPFELVRCHTFITESTFGLPVYQWPAQSLVFDEINAWWRANADAGVVTILYGYALGKAQRLLAGLDPTIGPILTHGAVERMTALYRDAGISMPATSPALLADKDPAWRRALVVAPPAAGGSTWARRFGAQSGGFASGWMRVRGARRRRGVDRGFTLSDHVDWPSLLATVEGTGAGHVMVTHGFTGPVVRWLTERGIQASAIATRFEGERDDVAVDAGDGADDGDVDPSGAPQQ